jgi:hypothetical protein
MVHLDYARRLNEGKGHARGSRFFNTAYDKRRQRALRDQGWRRHTPQEMQRWRSWMEMQRVSAETGWSWWQVLVVLVIQS